MKIKNITIIVFLMLTLIGCEKREEGSEDKRIPITIGTFLVENREGFDDARKRFEEENPDYRIEIREYNSEDEYKRFLVELSTGKAPDIIDMGNLPAREYISLGLFEDLKPYFDKDPDISENDLIDPVINAIKADGRIYYTASSFGINTLVASKKDIGDKKGWTVSEMSAYVESKGNDVQIIPGNSKTNILGLFTYSSIDDYIDWKNGRASFDNDEFKKILELSDRGLDDMGEKNPGERKSDLFSSGRLCFDNLVCVGAPDIAALRGRLKVETVPIGYPCKDRQGSQFILKEQYGMSSSSTHKDAAWNYLKIIMSKDHQYKVMYPFYTFAPTRKDCFDMYIEAMKAQKTYIDKEGNTVSPISVEYADDDSDLGYVQGPLSDDDIDAFIEILNNTHRICEWEHSLSDIINEEARKYFQKERTLDETVTIINDRIEKYISERK